MDLVERGAPRHTLLKFGLIVEPKSSLPLQLMRLFCHNQRYNLHLCRYHRLAFCCNIFVWVFKWQDSYMFQIWEFWLAVDLRVLVSVYGLEADFSVDLVVFSGDEGGCGWWDGGARILSHHLQLSNFCVWFLGFLFKALNLRWDLLFDLIFTIFEAGFVHI